MIQNIEVEITEKEKKQTLVVKGEVDIHTCPTLKEKLDIISEKKQSFILDLENISYIDSTGLGTIAYTARSLEETKEKIHIVCNKPQIIKIFKVSGLEKKNITLNSSFSEINKN